MERRFPGLRKRHCPECNVRMNQVQIGDGIEVERCPECDGIWLDHGELKEILQERISERANPRDMAAADRSHRMCPDCDRELFERHFINSRVRIDQCIQCAGIFLDGGELEQIRGFIEQAEELQSRR